MISLDIAGKERSAAEESQREEVAQALPQAVNSASTKHTWKRRLHQQGARSRREMLNPRPARA